MVIVKTILTIRLFKWLFIIFAIINLFLSKSPSCHLHTWILRAIIVSLIKYLSETKHMYFLLFYQTTEPKYHHQVPEILPSWKVKLFSLHWRIHERGGGGVRFEGRTVTVLTKISSYSCIFWKNLPNKKSGCWHP